MTLKVCGLRSDPIECENDPDCSVNKQCLAPCEEEECPLSLSTIQPEHMVKLEANGVVRCYDACYLDQALRYVGRTDPVSREPLSANQSAFVEHVARNARQNCYYTPSIDVVSVGTPVDGLVDSVFSMFTSIAEEESHHTHRLHEMPSRESLIGSFMAYSMEVGPYRAHLSDDVVHLALTDHDVDTICMLIMHATNNRNRNTNMLFETYMRNVMYPSCLSRSRRRVSRQIRRTLGVFGSHPAVPEQLRAWARTNREIFIDYMSAVHDAYTMFIRPGEAAAYQAIVAVSANILVMLQQRHEIPRMRFHGSYGMDEIIDDIITI